jgi:F-type H+-transporting ATPase subunit delta
MQGTKVATRYAKALMDLSLEKGQLEQVHNDMKLILASCKESRELVNMLKSPVIKSDKKEKVLFAVFSSINSITKEFIKTIVRKRREMHFEIIADAFIAQYRQHKKILTAIITTAAGLDDELRKKVIEVVKAGSNSEVELIEKVEPKLIGGFIIRVGDKQDDTSIRTKIMKLNRVFQENPYIKEF